MGVTLDDRPLCAYTTLSSELASGATTMSLTDPSDFPAPTNGYQVTIWGAAYDSPALDSNHEVVRITAKPANYTITRAQEGTSAQTWPSGSKVVAALCPKTIDDIEDGFATMLGGQGTIQVKTISSGSITITGQSHYVRLTSESGSSDTLNTLVDANAAVGDIVLFEPTSGHTIRIVDGAYFAVGDNDIYIGPDQGDKALFVYHGGQWCLLSVWSSVVGWTRSSVGSTILELERQAIIYESGATPSTYGNGMVSIIGSGRHPLTCDRRTDDGSMIDFRQDGTTEGSISVSGNTVTYGGFAGSHPTHIRDHDDLPDGAVVISTGEPIRSVESWYEIDLPARPGEDPRVGRVSLRPGETPPTGARERTRDRSSIAEAGRFTHANTTTREADPRVYGVYQRGSAQYMEDAIFGEAGREVVNIVGLGLYRIRVTDTAGDISAGDYLETSIRPGEAQKQRDGTLRNSTVAKALVDVEWRTVTADPDLGYKWQLIPATIHCG